MTSRAYRLHLLLCCGMCVTCFILGAMTGGRFMAIAPWPRAEQEKSMCSFVGGELNSLKLDLFVVGFSGGVYNLANRAKLLFEVNCDLPYRLELKCSWEIHPWSFLCVYNMARWKVELLRRSNFLLGERLFWGHSDRGSNLVQSSCQSCVHFDLPI